VTGTAPGTPVQSACCTSDIVGAELDAVGIAVTPEELELLVAACATMRARAASLYIPEAELFEPADVFSARDQA